MRYFATAVPGLHPVLAREVGELQGARAAPHREFDGRTWLPSPSRAAPSGGSRVALDELARVVQPGGRIVLLVPGSRHSKGHWDGSRRFKRLNGWSSDCWERGLLSGHSIAGEPPVVVVPDPSGAAEGGRDAVLGRLVAGAGAGGEAGDAG